MNAKKDHDGLAAVFSASECTEALCTTPGHLPSLSNGLPRWLVST